MPQPGLTNGSLERRLAGYEAALAAQQADIASILRDVHGLRQSLHDLAESIAKSTQFPWANLLSAVGVFLTVLGAFFWITLSSYVRDADRVERNLASLVAVVQAHVLNDGHPSALQSIRALQRRDERITLRMDKMEAAVLAPAWETVTRP